MEITRTKLSGRFGSIVAVPWRESPGSPNAFASAFVSAFGRALGGTTRRIGLLLVVVTIAACQRSSPPASDLAAPEARNPSSETADFESISGPMSAADQAPPLEAVGNNDPSGVNDQPDWDASAQALKNRVMPLIAQTKLSRDLRRACDAMIEEARRFYAAIEDDAKVQRQSQARWQRLHVQERQGCEHELSLTAVHCVTVSLASKNAEYAWLIDQCSRAFPRAPQASHL